MYHTSHEGRTTVDTTAFWSGLQDPAILKQFPPDLWNQMHEPMRQPVVVFSFLTLVLANTVIEAAQPSQGWYRNLAEAQQAARATRKPMFVVFRCET